MPEIRSDIVDVYPFRRRAAVIEFLLLRRSPAVRLGGTWQCVHGRIEARETAWQAALRELREETGLTPTGFWQIDYVNTFYIAADDVVMLCPCFAAEIEIDAGVSLSDEHAAFEWVRMFERNAGVRFAPSDLWQPVHDSLRRLMWPGQRAAVREIVAEIVTPSAAEPHLRIPIR